jgi:hypothetical protein
MVRQKLGFSARIRGKRNAKLAEKEKVIAKAVTLAPTHVVPDPDPKVLQEELDQAREAADVAAKRAVISEKTQWKHVKSGRAAAWQSEAATAVEVVKQLEKKAAEPVVVPPVSKVVPSKLQASLNMFDWSLIILSTVTESLNASKWWALGGAASLAGLYYLAEQQGWLEFITQLMNQ